METSPALAVGGEQPDEALIQQVLGGNTALFELLMRRYNERVYRAARSIVRDEHEAEDVMQQAYVNAYAHLHQFEGRARFSTWLARIAVHEALARARRRGRYESYDPSDDLPEPSRQLSDDRPDPERLAHATTLRRLLEAAVDGLPQIYRTVFVLSSVEGLGTAEVAACLEISEEAVRTRLHRARVLLRRDLYQRTGATSATAFTFHLLRCDRIVKGVLSRLNGPAGLAS